MTEQTTLWAQAHEIAEKNPPSKVLEDAFLGMLVGIGWVLGRAWIYSAKFFIFFGLAVSFMFLAVRLGYRKGAKVQVKAAAPGAKRKARTEHPPIEEMTPYGPNVQAYSERA